MKGKGFLSVALMMVFILVLTVFMSSSAEGADMETYEGDGFKIDYPEDWQMTESEGNVVFMKTMGMYAVTVAVSEVEGDVDSYKSSQLENIPGYEEISHDDNKLEYRMDYGVSSMRGLVVFFEGDKDYAVSCLCTEASYDDNKEDYFDPMIDSMEVEGGDDDDEKDRTLLVLIFGVCFLVLLLLMIAAVVVVFISYKKKSKSVEPSKGEDDSDEDDPGEDEDVAGDDEDEEGGEREDDADDDRDDLGDKEE